MSVIVCTECGNETEADEQFCESCGTYLGWWGEKLDATPEAVVAAEAQAEGEDGGTVTATAVLLRPPGEEAHRRPPRTLRQAWSSVPGELICGTCERPSPPSAHFCRTCGAILVGAPAVKLPWYRRLTRRRALLRAGDRPGWTRLVTTGPRRIPKRTLLLVGATLVAVLFAVLCIWLWAKWIGDWAGGVAHTVRRDVYPYYDPLRPANVYGDPQTKAHMGKAAFDSDLTTYWKSPGRTGIGGRLVVRLKPATDVDRISIFGGDPTGSQLVPRQVYVSFFRWNQKAKNHWVLLTSTGLKLANKPGFQVFPVTAKGAGMATITVRGVYAADSPGSASITEVEFFTKH